MNTLGNIFGALIMLTTVTFNSFSQEASIFSNYYLSPFIINPAVTGSEYYPMAAISAKKQWAGIPDSPSTYLLSGNYRIGTYDFYDPKGFVNKGPLDLKDRIGLGAAVYRDKNGPSDYTGGIISYAYHVPVNVRSELSFGMSVIGTYYSFNSAVLKPDQPDDIYLLEGNENAFRVNFNLGIYYHCSTYFLGLSATKILPDIITVNDKIKEQPSYFLMGGYKFRLNKLFTLEPSATIKKVGTENITLDIFSKLYIKRLNWVALSYSTSGKMNFLLGIHLLKMLYGGYSYEYSLSKMTSYTFGTHEIYLGINLGLIGVEGIRTTVNK